VLENGRRWSAGKTEFYLIGRNSVIIKCPLTIASFLRESELASRKPDLNSRSGPLKDLHICQKLLPVLEQVQAPFLNRRHPAQHQTTTRERHANKTLHNNRSWHFYKRWSGIRNKHMMVTRPVIFAISIEWNVTLNGKSITKDMEHDIVIAPSSYWRLILRTRLEELVQNKFPGK
jgi:hypothetical protein